MKSFHGGIREFESSGVHALRSSAGSRALKSCRDFAEDTKEVIIVTPLK